MDTVRFDLGNLTTVPYQRPIDVNVTVTLAHWNVVNIRPPGFRTPAPVNSPPIACNGFHVFNVGAAVCGDCAVPSITYLWQQSTDGGATWIPAVYSTLAEVSANLQNNTSQNFRTPRLVRPVYYFRRVATCGCRPERTVISPAARVTVNLCATIALGNPFAGAFWRNNQRGERLIRMTHPNNNLWTATAKDDWIQLCNASFTFPDPLAPGINDTPHLTNAGSSINGKGNQIYFLEQRTIHKISCLVMAGLWLRSTIILRSIPFGFVKVKRQII